MKVYYWQKSLLSRADLFFVWNGNGEEVGSFLGQYSSLGRAKAACKRHADKFHSGEFKVMERPYEKVRDDLAEGENHGS